MLTSAVILLIGLIGATAQPDCGANRLEFLCSLTEGCRWKNGACEDDGSFVPTDPPTAPTDPPTDGGGGAPVPSPTRVDVCRNQDNLKDFCEAFNAAAELDCKWHASDNTCRSESFENQTPPPSASPSGEQDPCSYLMKENCEDYNESECWKCGYSKSKGKCRWDGGDWEDDLKKLEKDGGCKPAVDDDEDPCSTITEGSCSRYNKDRCWDCKLNKDGDACEWKDGDWKDGLKDIEKNGCKGANDDEDSDPCRDFGKSDCKDYNESQCFKCTYNKKKERCEWKGNHKKDLKKIAKKGCDGAEQFPKRDPCRKWDDDKKNCKSNNDQFCWECDYDKKKDRCEWDGNYEKDQEKLVKKGCQATTDSYCHEWNDDAVMCVRKVGCFFDKSRDKNDRCFPVPTVVPQRK